MGIKNLHKFLKRHVPNIYKEIHISNYKDKCIAIDINVYLYKYKSINSKYWYNSFYKLVTMLRKHNIDCIFIYDTKAPIEKYNRIQERKTKKKDTECKIYDIKSALIEYKTNGTIKPILHHIMGRRYYNVSSLLMPNNIKHDIDIDTIEQEIITLQNQVINISKDDINLSKTILRYLNVPFYDSINEAETMCSYLCCHNKVDAVLSDDTDVLVYKTPIFLTKLNLIKETLTEINYNDILHNLQISPESFTDFCIMCGTDYNKNIYRIGHEKAFKLIKEHYTIENIRDKLQTNVDELNFTRVREIFTINPEIPDPNLNLKCGEPDINGLIEYCVRNNLKLSTS